MKYFSLILMALLTLQGCKSNKKNESTGEVVVNEVEETRISASVEITPISHATMVIEWGKKIIYVDPTGGSEAFQGQPSPNLILVTDIHGDHLNVETLQAIATENSPIVVPQAVMDKLPEDLKPMAVVLHNGQIKSIEGIEIEGIPMYNLREEALKFHEKGRGNGYVLELEGNRVYISGDTEDIPEMRNLRDINLAFVCMNLPYTMTVESAADAVLEFAPKTVIPYHYRGTKGLSDMSKFRELIENGNAEIEVMQLDWYPEKG